MKRTALPLLLVMLAQSFASTNARAEVKFDCPASDYFELPYKDQDAPRCTGAPGKLKCTPTLQTLGNAHNSLQSQLQASCDVSKKITASGVNAATVDAKSSYTMMSQNMHAASDQYKSYINELTRQFTAIENALKDKNGPLQGDETSVPKKLILGMITKDTNQDISRFANYPATSAPPSDDGTLFAADAGGQYLKKIANQILDTEQKITMAQDVAAKADYRAKNLDTPPPDKGGSDVTGTKKDDGLMGGMDLKTLAALGTAGAALAPLLNKQSDSNSSVSSKNTATATSPTPNANAQANAPKGPETSSLGGGPTGPAKVVATPGKPDPSKPAEPNRVPAGEANAPNSDISRSSAPTPSTGTTPPTAKAMGGVGGGLPGDGSPGDAAAAAAAAAKSAAGAPPSPEDTQGIGNGALGAGGATSLGGGSSSSTPPAATDTGPSAETAMTDLLHEMKDTVDGSTNGSMASADIPMGKDDLFPRVRACYTRIMKSGRVLDGLAEKITPENP